MIEIKAAITEEGIKVDVATDGNVREIVLEAVASIRALYSHIERTKSPGLARLFREKLMAGLSKDELWTDPALILRRNWTKSAAEEPLS